MKCPRDGSDLVEQRYEADIQVDACGQCGGVWLDDGELEAIQASSERDHAKDLARMGDLAGHPTPHLNEPARCPTCAAEMTANEYAYCSRIIIDACPEGHGVWLDGGELQALEVFFEKNRQETNQEEGPLWAARSFWVSLRGAFKKRG